MANGPSITLACPLEACQLAAPCNEGALINFYPAIWHIPFLPSLTHVFHFLVNKLMKRIVRGQSGTQRREFAPEFGDGDAVVKAERGLKKSLEDRVESREDL